MKFRRCRRKLKKLVAPFKKKTRSKEKFDRYEVREGDPISEDIQMDQPISCHYNGKCEYDRSEKKWIGEKYKKLATPFVKAESAQEKTVTEATMMNHPDERSNLIGDTHETSKDTDTRLSQAGISGLCCVCLMMICAPFLALPLLMYLIARLIQLIPQLIAAPFVRAAKEKENRRKEKENQRKEEENRRKEERAAKEIARGDKFTELILGYRHVHQEKFDNNGMRVGDPISEFMEMDQPIPCYYNGERGEKYFFDTNTNEWIPEKNTNTWIPETWIPETYIQPSTKSPMVQPPVEYKGITLKQLWAAEANMDRRCEEEGWRNYKGDLLTPDAVCLHDINKYVIRPFTKEKQESFVTTLPSTAGPQPPRFFISHWWGETFKLFVRCIEQAVLVDFSDENNSRGGGMTINTPFWVCAFANNQWALGTDIPKEPKDSGFRGAMEVAENRVISIVDKQAIVFTRTWCVYELYLTLVDAQREEDGEEVKKGLWAVYTAHKHTYECPHSNEKEERNAIGLISGGATIDRGNTDYTLARERAYPIQLVVQSLSIKIEDAEASKPEDRIHILNSIRGHTGNGIDDEPPKTDEAYEFVNEAVKGNIASSIGILQVAAKKDDKVWDAFLCALSRAKVTGEMKFVFKGNNWMGWMFKQAKTFLSGVPSTVGKFEYSSGWEDLTGKRATQLVANLPLTIGRLHIWYSYAKFGAEFMHALIDRVWKSEVKDLLLNTTSVGDKEGGQEAGRWLANMLLSNDHIERLTNFLSGVPSTVGKFEYSSGWEGLTAKRATQLVANLPLTIRRLHIRYAYANFGAEFMHALIDRVGKSEVKDLLLNTTSVGDKEGGQEAGRRLANMLLSNDHIERLTLEFTDLLVSENVEEWGDALMKATNLTRLGLDGVEDEIVDKLRERTKDREPKLSIVIEIYSQR